MPPRVVAIVAEDETPAPAVGQVWQDNDRRSYGRHLMIEDIGETHAVMVEVSYRPSNGAVTAQGQPRRTRVRLDRLRPTSTGYRYVTTVAGGVL